MAPPLPPSPTLAAKPRSFADIITITPDTSHTYSIQLQDSFCVGTVPNGGYITTAFLLAARMHMSQTHARISCPHPVNLHLQFLRRTAIGPATFHVRDVKLGSRISNLHVTLRQHRDPSDSSTPVQDEVEGYIVMTNLARESGLSHDTQYALHPPALPVSLASLSNNTDTNYVRRRTDPYGTFRRATLHVEMYLVRPTRRPEGSSLAIADQWVRFAPITDPHASNKTITSALKSNTLQHSPGRWTNDALGYLVDIFPQLNERYLNRDIEDAVLTPESEISDQQIQDLVRGTKPRHEGDVDTGATRTFWYPTLLLNLEVKKQLPDEGVEWLFVRVSAKRIEKGRFDLMVEVWDVEGDLVALSTHACLIMDATRNLGRKEKKDSKM